MEGSAACEVFLSVGTATVVYPAAELPLRARAAGARLVEINPSPTPISDQAHYVLRGPAGEILPALLQAWC
jgi:NAD-dependent deacetylase